MSINPSSSLSLSSSDPPPYNNDPLSLHSTDNPSTQLVSPKLNATNYLHWSRAMHVALSANNKLGFIDGTILKPTSPTEPTFNQWLRCDRIVISWIINSIQPHLSHSFLYPSSAKQLWDDIQNKFGVSSGALLYQLHRQITDTVQGDDSPVAVYYMTLKKVWDEFDHFFPFPTCACSCEGEFEQRGRLIKFLMGLNHGFDSVRAQILMMNPLPTVDTAFSMVLQVEKQRRIMNDISGSSIERGVVNLNNCDDCCKQDGRIKNSGECKKKPNGGDVEPDQDVINAIVQSVVKILKQKHGVELITPPQPEICDQKVIAQINQFDDKEQERAQKREQALAENVSIDMDLTVNPADPSPDLHKDKNQPSLADPVFGAAISDHNQPTTPIQHTVSPSPASNNQTTTAEYMLSPSPPSPASSTISHSASTGTTTKTKKKKAAVSDASTSETMLVTKKIGSYTTSQKILLVGEGDFSFSTCLAVAFGSASNMVATSLNSKEFLLQNYAKFSANEKELVTRGCIVLHGIDATKMATHSQLSNIKFHRIIFNFPHAGFCSEEKSTTSEMGRHLTLVSGFLRNAKRMLEKNGQIHIRHKCNEVFLKWNIPKLASDQGLSLVEEAPFERSKYPGYHTKYGFGGDKDFDCDPSKTYMFGLP